MTFYEEMAAMARELLEEFGQPVTIHRTTGEVRDPVTGEVTEEGSDQVFTPNGVLTEYANNLIDGTRITAADRMLILDDTVQPLQSDRPVINGVEWPIQEVDPVSPAGVDVIYTARVRR